MILKLWIVFGIGIGWLVLKKIIRKELLQHQHNVSRNCKTTVKFTNMKTIYFLAPIHIKATSAFLVYVKIFAQISPSVVLIITTMWQFGKYGLDNQSLQHCHVVRGIHKSISTIKGWKIDRYDTEFIYYLWEDLIPDIWEYSHSCSTRL